MGALETKTGLDLMIQYLDVCNVASEVHRYSLPYKPIIAAYDRFFANRQVCIDIYGKDAAEIETTVTIHLVNGRFEPVPETEAHSSFHLKLSRHYMEDVVAHREEYIRHPEKLDWDWLKSLMGMEAHHGSTRGANVRPQSERTPEPAADVRAKLRQ